MKQFRRLVQVNGQNIEIRVSEYFLPITIGCLMLAPRADQIHFNDHDFIVDIDLASIFVRDSEQYETLRTAITEAMELSGQTPEVIH